MSETFVEKQSEYIELVAQIMQVRARGEQPMAYIRTYGCQQNVADSETIRGMLALMGYSFTDDPELADLIIFNTCAVREHAEDRVFGNVGAIKSIKKRHPSTLIALCGCMMEQEHISKRIYKSFPFVGLVFGTHCLHDFPRLLYQSLFSGKRQFIRGNDDLLVHEGMPKSRNGNLKAWLPIMYGCDNFCSYCIVPYVRGRERSRKSDIILHEARQLIERGYKDLTLLGQNVNSYGKGLDEGITFAQLLKKIDSIDGDYILRFMTSHPKDCTRELIDTIASGRHISVHLHLPFQSGSDRILKQMNRHYTRQKYLDIVNYAKDKIPELSLTSDVIVGFPGETEDDFEQTISLIKEVGFTSLFTFIYSKRVGTPAEKMEDPTTHEEKTRRFQRLLKVQEEITMGEYSRMIGTNQRVLFEEKCRRDGVLNARTSGNIIVEVPADTDLIGNFGEVRITDSSHCVLRGELL